MLTRLLFVTALLTPALTAQITSPKGYLTTEGSTSHNYMLFAKAEMRWQAIDRSHVGGGTKVLREAAWRRDGTAAANANWIKRTLTAWEMNIGLADYSKLEVANLDNNFLPNSVVQVVKPRTLNVVDINATSTSPAPWTTVVKFDVPFIYTGKDALVWEVKYSSNTAVQDYSFDFQYVGSSSGYSSSSGTTVGTSCTSSGQTTAINQYTTFYNHGAGNKFRLYRSLYYFAANAPLFMMIDGADANLTVPGLCTKLHALPTITIPLGAADASGRLTGGYIDNIPHVASIVGKDLFFQYFGIDTGQSSVPISLSFAKKITVPADPVPTQVTRFYHYKNSPTGSTITSGPWYGGIITRFQ